MQRTTVLLASCLFALSASTAFGQDEGTEEIQADGSTGVAAADDPGAEDIAVPPPEEVEPPPEPDARPQIETLDDEQARLEQEHAPEEPVDSLDPTERPNTDYFFLGALYRQVVIPGVFQQPFVDGGIDGFNPGAGLTFNWRRNDFNVIVEAWWNNAAGGGFFRANGDPITDLERIDVNLFAVFIDVSLMWAFPITEWFAIEVGLDVGIGFIGGTLTRTEAYERPDGTRVPCSGPGDTNDPGGFCEPPAPDPCYNTTGGHYACDEPNWLTEGGDTPFVVPWLSLPHLALRFKPIRQLQIRVDGGYGVYNFFFGATAMYGF